MDALDKNVQQRMETFFNELLEEYDEAMNDAENLTKWQEYQIKSDVLKGGWFYGTAYKPHNHFPVFLIAKKPVHILLKYKEIIKNSNKGGKTMCPLHKDKNLSGGVIPFLAK